MGAWGHGVYDNDDALDTVSDLLDHVGINKGKDFDRMIPMANNTILTGEWTPSEGKLHQIVIQQLYNNFRNIERTLFKNNCKSYFDDKSEAKTVNGEQYLVLCDILQRHGYDIPNSSTKRAFKAISYLLTHECESTFEYDNPGARRNSISSVLAKIKAQDYDISAKDNSKVTPTETIIKKNKNTNPKR